MKIYQILSFKHLLDIYFLDRLVSIEINYNKTKGFYRFAKNIFVFVLNNIQQYIKKITLHFV